MLRNFKLRMPIFLLEPFSFVFLLLNRLNHKSKLNGKGVLEQKKKRKKSWKGTNTFRHVRTVRFLHDNNQIKKQLIGDDESDANISEAVTTYVNPGYHEKRADSRPVRKSAPSPDALLLV